MSSALDIHIVTSVREAGRDPRVSEHAVFGTATVTSHDEVEHPESGNPGLVTTLRVIFAGKVATLAHLHDQVTGAEAWYSWPDGVMFYDPVPALIDLLD